MRSRGCSQWRCLLFVDDGLGTVCVMDAVRKVQRVLVQPLLIGLSPAVAVAPRGISRNPVDSGGGEKHCLQLAQEWRQRCVGARQRPDKTDPSVRALSSARRPVPLRRQTLEVWEKVTCSADVDCLSADCVAVLAITTSQTWWCIS